jgi:hypothetical protein
MGQCSDGELILIAQDYSTIGYMSSMEFERKSGLT